MAKQKKIEADFRIYKKDGTIIEGKGYQYQKNDTKKKTKK